MKYLQVTALSAALLVCIGSVLTLWGWYSGSVLLTSGRADWVTVKVPTAVMFLFGGIALSAASTCKRSFLPMFGVSFFSQFITYTILTSLIGQAFNVKIHAVMPDTGILTVEPHMPSMGTLVGFLMVALAGVVWMFNTRKCGNRLRFIGHSLILLGGVCALFGYAFGFDVFKYHIQNISTAMAFETALLMVFLGTGWAMLGAATHGRELPKP